MGRGRSDRSGGGEPLYDWPEIFRAVGIIILGAAAFGLIVPIVGALAVGSWDTFNVSGSEIYRWLYWVIAWALTVWQGARLIRDVSERIIDDMLVVALVSAVALLLVKFIVWIAYEPRINYDLDPLGVPIFALTGIDVAGALALVIVALVGARANRY
jgi:hypothetical protein